MTSPAYCPSRLVLVARPAEFSQLCRSVLANDPVYGSWVGGVAAEPGSGLAALQWPEESDAAEPFLLTARLQGVARTHHS